MKAEEKQYSMLCDVRLSDCLTENSNLFQSLFAKDATFRMRKLKSRGGFCCQLFYLDGMVNSGLINASVVQPLIERNPDRSMTASQLEEEVLFADDVMQHSEVAKLIDGMLYGDTVLLIDGCDKGLLIGTKGWRSRGISEPKNETVLQGPREGFDEAAMQNLAMLRRKLLTADFAVESLRIGRRTGTYVFVCYLSSLADPKLVERVKKKLNKIDIDGILDSNYLNELIRDRPYSLFKTCGTTERPDVAAAKLLEGRVAILVDGTPVVLTVPYLFCENFQSDEDYYLNFWIASVGRFIRYLCFFLTVSVPALYLAWITYHKRLIPTFLLLMAATARQGVPFSSVVECLGLTLTLEILKETGSRMSQNLGHTLSIVGGLVVGQAAVEARLVSAPMLVVVAISSIAGLMLPNLRVAVFYWRLAMIGLAVLLGMPGCFLGLTLILIRVLGMKSFGVSYVSVMDPVNLQTVKDRLFRLPWSVMRERPSFNRNRIRQKRKR